MTASAVREFTGDQWAFLAHEYGLDRQPFPLRIAQTPQTEDEAHRLWSTFRTSLPGREDPWQAAVFRVLSGAQHQVAIYGGISVPKDAPPSPAQLRVHATVSGAEAVAITQAPGPSAEAGGELFVWYGPSSEVSEQLAAAVPPYPRGHTAELIASLDRVTGEYQPVTIFEPATPAPETQIRQLLSRPRAAEGWIQLDTHLGQQNQGELRTGWIDVSGDGRYLVRWPKYDVALTPLGPDDLRAYFRRALPAVEPASGGW